MAEERSGGETPAHTGPVKYLVLRTTVNQELNVALMLESIASNLENSGLYAVIVPPEIKGYIILEAKGLHVVNRLIRDIKHVKGSAVGSLREDEVERLIKVVSPIEKVKPGDIVEIVSGPFKGLKARVISVDVQKNVVTVRMLEASYSMEATLPGDDIRPVKKK
ncbi:MAG: transcription elongation factor Spt5 [Desulfurococcales archaeon]|nr:transcription elongation factor Spt5 [Desulfurococcales archaeon]